MSKCKCSSRTRIVSDVVQSMPHSSCGCIDYCTTPPCGDPSILSIYTPLIYDEIGINLCTTITLGTNIATTYPTVTNATVKVINVEFTNGADGVTIEPIPGRPNCYAVTLTNITITFAMNLYDSTCRLVATIYPTALYLPATTTEATYDEDTNPTSVTLEIFAPYGLAYDTTGASPTPVLNSIGFATTNNSVTQGINLYGLGKLLDLDITGNTATIGVTLVLQSLYYAGYKVKSAGRIDTPKGSILASDNTDCMKFVAGDLLDLQIKPLNLGKPYYDEKNKRECTTETTICGGCKGSGGCVIDAGGNH